MKKKILFLCSNMNIGGFQRSLISLLRCFDYEKYEVDLLLSNPDGILKKYLPSNVNILEPVISPDYYASFPHCIIKLVKQGHPIQALYRSVGGCISIFNKGAGFVFANKAIPKIKKHYDVAIDYNGQQLLYYLVDSVNADKKISYFHSDYKKWPYYKKTDERYYAHVDAIVTVSDECVSSMREVFPTYSEKIYRIENIISPRTVQTFSDTLFFRNNYQGTRLLTVGRVCVEKGVDLAIKTCKILKQKKYEFRWYWIGPYDKHNRWIQKIAQEDIKDVLILLGPVDNPYGYMKGADILVHPSKFEGKSVTVEEAKVLNIPIVATRYSTVYDQIEDGKTGIVVNMNAEQLVIGIETLMNDVDRRNSIVSFLDSHCAGNETELEKLYKIINE